MKTTCLIAVIDDVEEFGMELAITLTQELNKKLGQGSLSLEVTSSYFKSIAEAAVSFSRKRPDIVLVDRLMPFEDPEWLKKNSDSTSGLFWVWMSATPVVGVPSVEQMSAGNEVFWQKGDLSTEKHLLRPLIDRLTQEILHSSRRSR